MAVDRYSPPIETTSGPSFTRADLGPQADLARYEIELSRRAGMKLRGKVFVKDLLGLTGMEASLTRMAPGESVPYRHQHRTHEELYVVLGGRGEMQIDGQTFSLREGTIVRVATGGVRAIRADADSELRFLCVQARTGAMPDEEAKRDGIKVDGLTWGA
jgi:uncharacterized cupin superfamily protein